MFKNIYIISSAKTALKNIKITKLSFVKLKRELIYLF